MLKNWLYLSKKACLLFILFCHHNFAYCQFANYVGNGSFESLITCSSVITSANNWNALDSINGGFSALISNCNGNVPFYGTNYQWPRTENNFIGSSTFFCIPPSCHVESNRAYLRNRLKKTLVSGKTYCVKFYVNISLNSTVGMDGFGAYFGDNTIDTIKKTTVPLIYLSPQIQNPNNNLITDTLNWTLITGTFTAVGNEKFMVIGNFKSDANTNTIQINPTNLPAIFTDVCVDDVSCIEVNAPAYAGPDKNILSGQSIYLGRELDFAVDPFCYWYQLPGMLPLDTASGITVSPTVTTTYVVRQELECNSIKWDTVVVRVGYTGNVELEILNDKLKIYPNPASDYIELKIEDYKLKIENCVFEIINSFGQVMREEELMIIDGKALIDIKDLESGVYVLTLSVRGTRIDSGTDSSFRRSDMMRTVSKRFVIKH